ncbi:MAG: hypothetical protein HYR90_00685 [Candidatus Andersenbacteria bacterium]|nr:hypothetical protein [Candidatus Andersenbacteria bacterium]MBI3251236.1 hypothetical protein [Candidatus Andersenbacteria bacterium]
MALAIGLFPNSRNTMEASNQMARFGITRKDIAVATAGEAPQSNPVKPLSVSGFLEDSLRRGGIRTVGTDIVIQMVREGISLKDAFASLQGIKKGYTMLAVHTQSSESPWIAELMRRNGAVEAHDSETEAGMKKLAMVA